MKIDSLIIVLIENCPDTQDASGIDRYNEILIKQLNKYHIDYIYVTAFRKPDFVKENNCILLTQKKVSNFIFLFIVFLFILSERKSNRRIYHLHHAYVLIAFILKLNLIKVLTIHDQQEFNFERKHGGILSSIYKNVSLFCIKRYDHLFADNRNLFVYYSKLVSNVEKKISIVNVPFDEDYFKPTEKGRVLPSLSRSSNGKIILFVARLESQKRPLLVLDIFKKIKLINKSLKLIVIGNGSLGKEMIKRMREENISDIKLIPNVSKNEIVDFYHQANVLIVTSIHEGGPIVVKEALACNVPVVSTDVGDVKELINEIDGCYIAEPTVDDFVNKIRKSLDKKDFESRSKILEFNSHTFGEKVIRIYKKLSEIN